MLLNTFFAASMVFPNNPLSFNMLSASDIMFISYRIRHHMTNSMKHKYNINTSNNTSVITYYRAYITFSKAPGLHCQESLREIFAILVAAVLPQRRFFIDYFLKSFSTLQWAITKFTLTGIYTLCAFSQGHCRVIYDTFIFSFPG